MKISIFGNAFLRFLPKEFEKEGHIVFYRHFSPDVDILITNGIQQMYHVYKNLKTIKKNKIKFINFIMDIPPWRLDKKYPRNSIINNFKQNLYHYTHKNYLLNNCVDYFTPNSKKRKIFNIFSSFIQNNFNKYTANQTTYLKNYRKLLTYSDLNLSISKFTQKCVKTYLNINSEVCHVCVNSDLLSKMLKSKIKYDAINISRIVPHKRQELFVKAAKKLGLNVIIIGDHQDKTIKLDCPHFFISDQFEVFKKLNEARFYVDASIFEGFGMSSVEAAYLDKISVVSDTYVHKEILGNYPIYFRKDNFTDLVKKMKMAMDGQYSLNNNKIKKKYSIQAFKKRLSKYIESI